MSTTGTWGALRCKLPAHEVLRQSLEPVGLRVAAHEMRVSGAMVERWCSPGEASPLLRVLEILRLTGNREGIEWLCLKSGGFFVPERASEDLASLAVLRALDRLVCEFSTLLAQVTASLADDRQISPAESEQIRLIWQQFKSVGEAFVLSLPGLSQDA